MQYRKYRDTQTSLLGLGCMRFPTVDGDPTKIDEPAAEAVIDMAYENGVNYFDTAYVYGDGASERCIGKALKKYPRESYFLTDKMPPWPMNSREDVARLFDEELQRCGVDYFDFYLCHNINEETIDKFLDPNIGAIPFLEEMQRIGKIRYLGFSSHGRPETLRRFASLRKWDFAQIQLNYLDWENQDAKSQYEILTELGIPVMVMEPVRGGRLSSLGPEADDLLRTKRPDCSVSSWALRFVAELPNVQVILSGMNTVDQLRDNLATLSNPEPLSAEERDVLTKAVDIFRNSFTVPCTGCGYCSGCPMELDIPAFLKIYNEYIRVFHEYAPARASVELDPIRKYPGDRQPKACVGCGQCAEHCPQHIDVPRYMLELSNAMEQPEP